MRKLVLGGESFGPTLEIVANTSLALRQLNNNPGEIYYASALAVVPQCKIKTLPIGRQAGWFIAPYQDPYVPTRDCPQKRNQLNTQAFQSGDDPITRRLFVVIKENNQMDQEAGEAYGKLMLADEDQALIKKAGFVPIR